MKNVTRWFHTWAASQSRHHRRRLQSSSLPQRSSYNEQQAPKNIYKILRPIWPLAAQLWLLFPNLLPYLGCGSWREVAGVQLCMWLVTDRNKLVSCHLSKILNRRWLKISIKRTSFSLSPNKKIIAATRIEPMVNGDADDGHFVSFKLGQILSNIRLTKPRGSFTATIVWAFKPEPWLFPSLATLQNAYQHHSPELNWTVIFIVSFVHPKTYINRFLPRPR